MKYYNLQVHSCYDLLNSTIKLDELFKKLKDDNAQAVCISDPNMYAAIKSHRFSEYYGIQLIHALEIKVSFELRFIKLSILAKNKAMFFKLLQLSTEQKTKETEITLEDVVAFLEPNKEDCFVIVNSELNDSLKASDISIALSNLDFYFSYNENYEYNLYSNLRNIVYTKDSYYLNYDNYQPLVVARAIKDNIKLNIDDLHNFTGPEFVYRQEDFKKICANILNPLTLDLVKKSVENQQFIVENCNYKLQFNDYCLPKYTYSEDEEQFKDKSSVDYLHYLVEKGASEKLVGKDIKKYKERFDYELKIINEMGFADYFLIVHDFVKYAKDNGIVVGVGRGSAVGSLVCYLLNITEADPLEYNLLFERFLNKERISMPDIDIDFQDTRRDEVIKYVEDKYGKDRVAQIITFTTFQSKSAARESGRILQFGENDLKEISSLLSSNKSLASCYEEYEELRDFVNQSEQYKRWFKVALSLEHLPKNPSVHAAGVIISDSEKLISHTALDRSNVTEFLTQWTMDDLEYVGLLKIDFLGIRYLTMIDNIVKEIKKFAPEFSINNINLQDQNVFQLFTQGKTEGIFQFESSGMKEKLRLLKPTKFNDIVAMNALYRPGPMAQIETYIHRKHKVEKVFYPHPHLEKILKDTYGVIVYQEQIMLIAVDFAKMTLNEADNMRRAVSKKKKDDLEKYGEIFIKKTVEAGYDIRLAQHIFDLIVTFANYGFNKSHAVAYSMIAYQLAYLKVYYNKYFMTALLNNVISSERKINEYKQELNNMGIKLISPNINISDVNFTVYKENIIFALIAIKNVGYRSAIEIVNERNRYGKFLDIDDFLNRMDKKVDYQAAVCLVKAGALDTFGYNRATIMNKIKDYYEDKRENISSVRAAVLNLSGLTLKVEEVEDYSIQEKIAMEKEVTGTYFLKHPVQVEKEKYYYLPLKYMGDKKGDSYVEVISVKEITTKTGASMCFLTVNDGKNDYAVTVFPTVFNYVNVLLKKHKFLVMNLTPQIRNDRKQYILEKATTIDRYNEFCFNNIKQIFVLVDNENENFIKQNTNNDGKVTVFCISRIKSQINEKRYVENAQNFVRKFISEFDKKPIKLNYE